MEDNELRIHSHQEAIEKLRIGLKRCIDYIHLEGSLPSYFECEIVDLYKATALWELEREGK